MTPAKNHGQFKNLACLWMVAGVLAGIGMASTLAPWIFKHAPNDLLRTSVLLDALKDETLDPKFVVLGNSIVMSGINTQAIAKQLPGQPLGFNLATTGQNPVDSYLYYQNLPDSVELIVQFTSPRFAANTDAIEAQKYNAMYMYGYRPNAETQAALTSSFGEKVGDIFAMSSLAHRFKSRWAIQQTADNLARSLVRDDLDFTAYTFNLSFPNNGSLRLPDAQIKRALQRRYVRGFDPGFPPLAEKTAFYIATGKRTIQSGKKYALVIPPLHPGVHVVYGDSWYKEIRDYFAGIGQEGDFAVIDATDAVNEEHFVDALHLSKAGGAQLSEFVADELLRLNLAPDS
jgi:hypothetical protein